jgi:hypothetical protein
MSQDLTPLPVADTDPLQRYTASYLMVRAVCTYGHERQLPQRMIQRWAGRRYTLGALRLRMRCSKCGRREPAVHLFKMPR